MNFLSRKNTGIVPNFIVLEGIDGAGKTTLSQALEAFAKDRKIPARFFREPTNYETGIRLREYLQGNLELTPEEELELFLSDRKESVSRNIVPSLKAGFHTILDRYYYSTAAYQWKSGLEPATILEANKREGFPTPDFVIFLEIPIEKALDRISFRNGRNGTLERFESKQELKMILERYDKILPPTCIRLDSTKPISELVEELEGRIFS